MVFDIGQGSYLPAIEAPWFGGLRLLPPDAFRQLDTRATSSLYGIVPMDPTYQPPSNVCRMPDNGAVIQSLCPAPYPADNDDLTHFAYQQRPDQCHDQYHNPFSDELESEALSKVRDMHCASTPNPTKTKDVKYNKPTHSAKEVIFTTAVDTLMKAIQKQSDSGRNADLTPFVTAEPPQDLRQSQGDSTTAETVLCSAEEAAKSTKTVKARKYACDVDDCGKSFYQSAHLHTHKRAHTGAKPYACNWPRCGQTFSQPGNLKTHMRRHTGEKPFVCEQCRKRFAQRCYLKSHEATHTGVQPFICKLDECNKLFTQRGNLKVWCAHHGPWMPLILDRTTRTSTTRTR
ncbi:C2H2 transcription factor [Colletotrichum chrysophilum]|uniref:C2H2 transcription factor n=1 Tax=Colletotrichum chrysophilum TaxID=1836956 RepID=A0AAD9EDH0_9PEZI|nr:C2H2 transcription factor [Colletotrichum chrysophilum]